MGEQTHTPITNATIEFYTLDDTLVGTATLSNVQYVMGSLVEGEYYYKITAPDKGTVIENITLPESGNNTSNVYKTIAMVEGINDITVNLTDKDNAVISDAEVKISRIPAAYNGSTNLYDINNVPKGVNKLHITKDGDYQSIFEDISILAPINISRILYPPVTAMVKIFIDLGDDTENIDITNKFNCKLYDDTGENSVEIPKINGYFKFENKNNGAYNLRMPIMTTLINGDTYNISEIRRTIYLDYGDADENGIVIMNITSDNIINMDASDPVAPTQN